MTNRKLEDSQISLRAMILIMLIGGLVMALITTYHEFVQSVAVSVVAANVLGAIVALFVTHVLRMPRDGDYRHRDEPED